MSAEVYLDRLALSVRHRLHAFLSTVPAVGGINLKGTLEQQQPLTIKPQSDVETQVHLRTYKEHWRWKYCKMSLEATGLYEAPGNLFWLSTNYPQWKGQRVPGMDMSYGELAGGREMWSHEKFLRSGDSDNLRMYIINGALPTAVSSIQDVSAAGDAYLVQLPCFGSRGVLAGFYSVMDDALRACDYFKVRRLYEAALSMPMRVRAAPSLQQITVDSLSYSEELFAGNSLTSDSFFDFVVKVASLLGSAASDGSMNSRLLQKRCSDLAVTFHGQPIAENIARAILVMIPFLSTPGLPQVVKQLQDTTKLLNEYSKCCGVFSVASKALGKGTPAAASAVCDVLHIIRVLGLYKEVAVDSFSKDFLLGSKKKAFSIT